MGVGGELNKNSKETTHTYTYARAHTEAHTEKGKKKTLKTKASPESSQNKTLFCPSAGNKLIATITFRLNVSFSPYFLI